MSSFFTAALVYLRLVWRLLVKVQITAATPYCFKSDWNR